MSELTAVLVSYRRPENMHQVIDALRSQTLVPELMLINNFDAASYEVDKAAYIPWNAGPMARYLLGTYAETEWLMFLDDDLKPGDAEFVADALALAKERPGSITGAFGRLIAPYAPYYRQDAWGNVAVVKGRIQLMRKQTLARARLPEMGDDTLFACDDIYVSLETGRGFPIHWADKDLKKRLVELPKGGPEIALSLQEEHGERRERACRWWLENRLI